MPLSLDDPQFIRVAAKYAESISSVDTLEQLVDLVENLIEKFVAIDYSGIFLYDPDENRLRLYYAKGLSEEEHRAAEATLMDRHPGWVYRNKKVLHVPDTEKDELHLTSSSPRAFTVRSRLFFPVMKQDECIGVFGIASKTPNCFTNEDIQILAFICDLAVVAYSNIFLQLRRQRVEAELLLKNRAIAASSNSIIIFGAKDDAFPIIYVNPAFEILTGYSESETLLRNGWFLCGKDLDQPGRAVIEDAIRNRRECNVLLRMYRKDGTMFWSEIRLSPIFDEDKNLAHYIAIQNDVTERIAIDEELVHSRTIAEESLAAKEEFFLRMSHEIRTPMNGIIGIANLLLETDLDHDQTQLLNNITFSADSLLVVVSDILDLAKIEAGRLILQNVRFSLRNVLENTIRNISVQITKKDITLEHSIDPAIPQYVIGDPYRLSQIFLNLTSNAIKFTNQGAIAVHAHLLNASPEAVTIRFIFSDSGIGIAQEHIPNLFRKFYQAHSVYQYGQYGSGLGLFIVKQLVELHKGGIEVQSEIGKGTQFTVTIPFTPGETDAVEQRQSHSKIRTQTLKDCRVLVAEDNPVNLMVIRRTLSNWGAKVASVTNGIDCLDLLSEEKPFNIILLDVKMPGMDGYATATAIRHFADPRKAAVPIIALSASVLDEIYERMREAGMDAYVTKPFNPKELLNTMLDVLHQTPEINEDESTDAAVDLSYFEAMAGGDIVFLQESIRLTMQQVEALTARLHKAHDRREYGALFQAAHQLKPLYKMLALERCAEILEQISIAARENRDAEHQDGSMAFLQRQAVAVVRQLEHALETASEE